LFNVTVTVDAAPAVVEHDTAPTDADGGAVQPVVLAVEDTSVIPGAVTVMVDVESAGRLTASTTPVVSAEISNVCGVPAPTVTVNVTSADVGLFNVTATVDGDAEKAEQVTVPTDADGGVWATHPAPTVTKPEGSMVVSPGVVPSPQLARGTPSTLTVVAPSGRANSPLNE
jgi:hypothetical protein